MQATPLTDAAIRDTIAAVFRAREYGDSTRWTVLRRLGQWWRDLWDAIADLLAPVGDAAGQSPLVKGLLLVILTTIVGLVVGRIAHALYARRDRGARGWRGGLAPARSRGGRDPWVIAQEAAARGDFTAAAHALYQALLEAVARRGEVRLHESKTLGDYVRELRARSSALFGRFRDFARAYETVIYGIGVCDRERFERLRALALPVIRPDAR